MGRYFGLFLCCSVAIAQTAPSPSGKWVSHLKFFDNDNYDRMQLDLSGDTKLSGKLVTMPSRAHFKMGELKEWSKAGR
jgi:hypothetical protein